MLKLIIRLIHPGAGFVPIHTFASFKMGMRENSIFLSLQKLIEEFEKNYSGISDTRKGILHTLAAYVKMKSNAGKPARLTFICTHNSRRSHIAQVWAQTAAAYYGIENVNCFSGGTEATAFNPRAVKALRDAGFKIIRLDESGNPRYEVRYADHHLPLVAFSKVYSDPFNPPNEFAAVMTCSHADQNCPLVTGTEKRISLPFDDPKDFDGTALEEKKYHERVLEIGREISYAFSRIRN
jgi:arsenate reductase (thioredoxin)